MDTKTILIVDDEQDIRTILRRRFELSGFECLTAKNGREAIKLAKDKKPSLIILDLVMTPMNGFEIYKALKANDTTKDIPIIPYTAQSPEVVAAEGSGTLDLAVKGVEMLDIIDFMLKPCDGEALMTAVDKALSCPEKVRLTH